MRVPILFTAIAALHAPLVQEEPVSPSWVDAWRADLRFVSVALPERHANLFHTLAPDEFDAAIDDLSDRVPSMSHHEIVVELAAIVAAVNDGHTRLTLPLVEGAGFFQGHSTTPAPNEPALLFHHYPIRLYEFSDGLFVRSIGRDDAALVGAKVARIGRMSADDALAAVSRVIHRDNEMQIRRLRPSRLSIPEVLHALEIVNDMDRAEFVLEARDGELHTLVLAPVPEGGEVQWVDARSKARQAPYYLRNTDANFWFDYLEKDRAVYFQYNEVYDEEDESVAEFAKRLTDFIGANDVEKLVIDLRFNLGGNNGLNRSLLHALIRCPEIQEPGSLFVIIGRGTFSAAMMFAIDLEKHTNAVFVGEPTGSSLNHYGDSRKVQLPNTGLTIRASTLYWQYSGPTDDRPWIEPHIRAELSSEDYLLGRDPALQTILDSPAAGVDEQPGGTWAGRVFTYKIAIHMDRTGSGWQASIDFPDQGATELPLTNVRYESPWLRFDFDNGGEVISFLGKTRGGRIIGGATMEGQTYPWVVSRESREAPGTHGPD